MLPPSPPPPYVTGHIPADEAARSQLLHTLLSLPCAVHGPHFAVLRTTYAPQRAHVGSFVPALPTTVSSLQHAVPRTALSPLVAPEASAVLAHVLLPVGGIYFSHSNLGCTSCYVFLSFLLAAGSNGFTAANHCLPYGLCRVCCLVGLICEFVRVTSVAIDGGK